MPKIVDHEQKRKLIAESAWHIIEEKGVEHASIRAVAAAAGLSPGALRHYFSTQDELLLFIVDYYLTRGATRAEGLEISRIPMKAAKEILLQLLPMDAEKRTAAGVWWIFAIRSLTSSAVQAKKDELTDGLHYLTKAAIEILSNAELLPSSVDIPFETLRLAAVVEGLTILALLRPEHYTPETVEQIVTRHLQDLCSRATDR
ncbi:TetR/AcrR family transcriptional regulator [Paenibacillus ginsengarvi]|uniref:TetR family transcriptional regulator n=1 Tax=Paenibacillus ginsengarvi TaxID=400777 RepID=A0A3B0BQ22_9BACL|nr:TetR family transcriptional regulator C-terminal domain-containing protein [Paenibacillus ginsengarvi]RKN74900.1 TetR family transcriptional regulator [Paenibacillus ginsengarvi]